MFRAKCDRSSLGCSITLETKSSQRFCLIFPDFIICNETLILIILNSRASLYSELIIILITQAIISYFNVNAIHASHFFSFLDLYLLIRSKVPTKPRYFHPNCLFCPRSCYTRTVFRSGQIKQFELSLFLIHNIVLII